MPTASSGIRTRSRTLHCSQTTSAVMILVVLAIRLRPSAFRSKITRPVAVSSNIAFSAEMASADSGKNRTAAMSTAAVPANILFIFLTRG